MPHERPTGEDPMFQDCREYSEGMSPSKHSQQPSDPEAQGHPQEERRKHPHRCPKQTQPSVTHWKRTRPRKFAPPPQRQSSSMSPPHSPIPKATRRIQNWKTFRKANASFGSSSGVSALSSNLGSIDERSASFVTAEGWEALEDDDDENDDLWMDASLKLSDVHSARSRLSNESFHDSYNLGDSLGEGAFGTVNRCHPKEQISQNNSFQTTNSDNNSQASFAVKSVPAEIYNPEEMDILQDVQDCPNVVYVKDVFHEQDQTHIVMEELQGGELFKRLGEKGCYPEAQAKRLFKTLLQTVGYLHDRGIAHLDIKPENIMLTSKDNDTDMKLVDFGLAQRFRCPETGKEEPIMDMVGSAEYAAPEVFNRPPDGGDGFDGPRADLWSCGVLLYVLLGGYAPFEAETTDRMIQVVGKGKFKFHKQYWKDTSREAKILIAGLMTVDVDQRYTLEQALASPWFDEPDH